MFGIRRRIDALDVQKWLLASWNSWLKAKSELCLIDHGFTLFALCQNQLHDIKNRKY